MKRIVFTLVTIVVVVCSCQFQVGKNVKITEITNSALTQEVFTPEENGYRLVWEDNFNGTELDTAKWKLRGMGPRRIGYNDASMVKVENGNLLLMYDIKGDSILAGAVGTADTYQTTYGYFECRARLQKGVGPWAAFWMQSPQISYGEDPAKYGTEIDVFEYFNELGSETLTHSLHWAYGPNQQTCGQLVSRLDGLSEGYHLFALEWTPEKYVFYIDGLKFHEKNVGLSHIDEYMILSMEIRSSLEGHKNACAPDTFKVDYVKVYKNN